MNSSDSKSRGDSPARVIAIDGPSGSGKSTVAKAVAAKLNVLYIDTGSMYRSLAYYCDLKGIAFVDGPELDHFLNSINLEYGVSEERLVQINGENLTQKIREHHVSALASQVSQLSVVRKYLLDFQRQLAREVVCVMEGRDIGSVVFPDAFCKFYITASIEVRAKRRLKQLIQSDSKNQELTLDQVINDVVKRDQLDTNRAVAPLVQAEDAFYYDTSEMSFDEIVESVCLKVNEQAAKHGIEWT